jgi:hypothetical protein
VHELSGFLWAKPQEFPWLGSSGVPSSSGVKIMSKSQHSNKEAKKHVLLTPKEKKAAKQLKKHAGDAVPIIVKGS